MKVKVIKTATTDDLEGRLEKILKNAKSVSHIELMVVQTTLFCVVVYEDRS